MKNTKNKKEFLQKHFFTVLIKNISTIFLHLNNSSKESKTIIQNRENAILLSAISITIGCVFFYYLTNINTALLGFVLIFILPFVFNLRRFTSLLQKIHTNSIYAGALIFIPLITTMLVSHYSRNPLKGASLLLISIPVGLALIWTKSQKVRIGLLICTVIIQTICCYSSITYGSASIDVFGFNQLGANYLLHGINPYTQFYPLVAFASHSYNKMYFIKGPYLYGPGVLLLSVIGRVVGDVRVTNFLVFILIVGILLNKLRLNASLGSSRAIMLFSVSPLITLMIINDWPGMLALGFTLLWFMTHRKHKWLGSIVLGLTFSIVPTTAALFIIMFFWLPGVRKQFYWSILICLIICLPFALWTGIGKFLFDIVGIHVFSNHYVSTILSSVNINTILYFLHIKLLSGKIWLLLAMGCGSLLVMRRPTTNAELFRASALLSLLFLLFSPIAEVDYFFIPFGLFLFSLVFPEGITSSDRII